MTTSKIYDNQTNRTEANWDVMIPDNTSDWVLRRRVTVIPKTKAGSLQWQQGKDVAEIEIAIPKAEIGTVIAELADWMQYAMTHGLDED